MKEYTDFYGIRIKIGDGLTIDFGEYEGKAKVGQIDDDTLHFEGVGQLEDD